MKITSRNTVENNAIEGIEEIYFICTKAEAIELENALNTIEKWKKTVHKDHGMADMTQYTFPVISHGNSHREPSVAMRVRNAMIG